MDNEQSNLKDKKKLGFPFFSLPDIVEGGITEITEYGSAPNLTEIIPDTNNTSKGKGVVDKAVKLDLIQRALRRLATENFQLQQKVQALELKKRRELKLFDQYQNGEDGE